MSEKSSIYSQQLGQPNMKKDMIMSLDEELEFVKAIQNGDEGAIKRLKQIRLRFVEAVAKQFRNRGLAMKELVEEGNKGLLIAAKRFDEQRGFKFIPYAVWWIRDSIKCNLPSHFNRNESKR